ncbi:uncharacterized protein LOC143288211 [Babylonia areolata]|uniref:uncharacterized protein LOC143288211 n=1 Tax=Babylonia areolata TaxID=304850 RepID=UPI003FCF730F
MSTRPDIPMIPVPVFPQNASGYMPPGGDSSGMMGKAVVPGGRGMHGAQLSAAPLTAQEPLQLLPADSLTKAAGEQPSGDTTEVVDPNRLKFWNTEETMELIQLYKKYLPEFHKFGQRKMNVWQRVTEEMVAKGYGNFSWAECSAKFRSLRDSYRRTSTGGRAQTWQYYGLMKEVMKMEKMILEQEPAARSQKGTITCEGDVVHNPSVAFPNAPVTIPNSAVLNPTGPVASLPGPVMSNPQHPTTSHTEEGQGEGTGADLEGLGRKRVSTEANGPAAKKSKDADQDTEVVIGRNFNGEPVKAKTRKTPGPLGVLGSLQALGKSLSLPQSQLVVSDDGQIVQTTSAPTGLYINDSGQLCGGQTTPARQAASMPQWFKMFEKRTRAENTRRLEELKEMHREVLEMQRENLEVARQKNEMLKNLMESLAEFKALLLR